MVKISIAGWIAAGLLTACVASETKRLEVEEVESPVIDEAVADDSKEVYTEKREMEAVSPEYVIPEHLREGVKEWVADLLEEFNRPPEERFHEAANDIGYVYYLRAKEVHEALYNGLGKDFDNLHSLAGSIVHSQYVRTASVDENGNAMEDLRHVNEWSPLQKSTNMYYEYMQQLLHDLNVAINKSGVGKTYGVTHLLDGDKVEEMESFISCNDVDGI